MRLFFSLSLATLSLLVLPSANSEELKGSLKLVQTKTPGIVGYTSTAGLLTYRVARHAVTTLSAQQATIKSGKPVSFGFGLQTSNMKLDLGYAKTPIVNNSDSAKYAATLGLKMGSGGSLSFTGERLNTNATANSSSYKLEYETKW